MQSRPSALLPLSALVIAACHTATAPDSSLSTRGRHPQNTTQHYDTGSVVQRLRLPAGGRPFAIARSAGGTALVTLLDGGKLARAELSNGAFDRTIAVGATPSDVAFNSTGTRAYVTNQFGGSISIVDVAANQAIGTIAEAGDPWRVRVAPGDSILWATNNAGGIFAYRLATGQLVATLHAATAVNGVAIAPQRAWFSALNGTVLEVDTRTYRITRTFAIGGSLQDVILSHDGRQLYVADETGKVQFVDLTSGRVATTIALPGGGGFAMALSDDGDDLYVSTGYSTGKVWVIDPPERRIEHVFNTGGVPRRMVIERGREGAIVANEDGFVDIIR